MKVGLAIEGPARTGGGPLGGGGGEGEPAGREVPPALPARREVSLADASPWAAEREAPLPAAGGGAAEARRAASLLLADHDAAAVAAGGLGGGAFIGTGEGGAFIGTGGGGAFIGTGFNRGRAPTGNCFAGSGGSGAAGSSISIWVEEACPPGAGRSSHSSVLEREGGVIGPARREVSLASSRPGVVGTGTSAGDAAPLALAAPGIGGGGGRAGRLAGTALYRIGCFGGLRSVG